MQIGGELHGKAFGSGGFQRKQEWGSGQIAAPRDVLQSTQPSADGGPASAGRGYSWIQLLIEVLVQFDDVDTGMSPPVTFGPNRRVGAAGAYIAQVDFERQTLVPIGE